MELVHLWLLVIVPRVAPLASGGGDLESRVRLMESNLQVFQNKQSADKVEEDLKNVRTLAGRPKLTSPSVLLAALEVLVQCATKACHTDSEYYSRALQACRQYEDHPDICTLCLKLLGSSEDRKISNTIADWVKSKKYDVKPEVKEGNEKTVASYQQFGSHFPFPPYPMFLSSPHAFHNMGFPTPTTMQGMGFPPFSPGNSSGRSFARPRQGRRVCFYCILYYQFW